MTITCAHPWRRRLMLAGMSLLAGAVTTVGVAWGCSVWAPEPSSVYRDDWSGPKSIPWRANPPAGWPADADDCDIERTRLITDWSLTAGGRSFSTAEFQHQEVVESGWPMRAMCTVWHTEGSMLASSPGYLVPSSS